MNLKKGKFRLSRAITRKFVCSVSIDQSMLSKRFFFTLCEYQIYLSLDVITVFESNTTSSTGAEIELDLAIYGMSWVNVGLATLGLAGNALAYVTASRLSNQTTGTGLMKYLAVTDSLASTTTAVQSAMFGWFQWSNVVNNDYTCMVMRFLAISFRNSGYSNIDLTKVPV